MREKQKITVSNVVIHIIFIHSYHFHFAYAGIYSSSFTGARHIVYR